MSVCILCLGRAYKYTDGRTKVPLRGGAEVATNARRINGFISKRAIILLFACIILALGLTARLFYLQVLRYDYYESIVLNNVSATTTVSASRGVITDRNGVQLASNYTVYRIFIAPREIENEDQKTLICQGLSDILGVSVEKIREQADMSYYADRTIKKIVEEEQASAVKEFIADNKLSRQIYVEPSTKRYYPYNDLAAQVIGFVSTDGGMLGIEKRYDKYLTGTPGRYITARDAWGKSMTSKYETYVEGQDGYTVETTLDVKIQGALDAQLEKTYNESKATNRVTGIVLDVNTGGVLAMGTYPSFDLNNPYEIDDSILELFDGYEEDANQQRVLENDNYSNYAEVVYDFKNIKEQYSPDSDEYSEAYMNLLYSTWKNKSVSELYEPGSTFKVITTSMALEENLITPDTEFTCTTPYVVEGIKIRCHKYGGHGTNKFRWLLQQSCNPTLIQIAQLVGREKFYNYFEAFGYTSQTGIDLPAESSPIYHNFSGFNAVELATYSFGQTFKISPIRQITGVSTVANGGYLITPHIVSRVVDGNGNPVYNANEEPQRQVVSTEVCRTIWDILEEGVATDGGAKNTYVPGYKIAAKTGTSEVRDVLDDNGNSFLRVGSTVAFAPADDPQIACIIVCDEPMTSQIYGAYVAAPYVAAVMEEVLPYIGVERQWSDEERAKMNTTVRDYVGAPVANAITNMKNLGIKYNIVGNGEEVTYQAPAGGSAFNKSSGTVTLYSGDAVPNRYITVPNLEGLSASGANQRIVNAGLNPVITGATNSVSDATALVVSQEPAAGSSVLYGSTVTVTLRFIGDTDA